MDGRKKTKWTALRNALIPGLVLLAYGLINRGFPCVIRSVTGLPCPSCGVTRALLEMVQGHWAEAFYWHPLWPLLILGIFIYLLYIQPWRPTPRLEAFVKKPALWVGMILLVLGVYVFRMIVLFPDQPPLDLNRNAPIVRVALILRGKA